MQKSAIFISAVSSELKSARIVVSTALQFLGYEPIWQDIFGTEQGDLCQMLRKKIDHSQGVIQLVGHRYGAEPAVPDMEFGRVSYTQYEALYAKKQKKKVWYLILAKDFPVDVCPQESPDLAQLQEAYRATVENAPFLYLPAGNHVELKNRIYEIKNDLEEFRIAVRRQQRRVNVVLLMTLMVVVLVGAGIVWLMNSSNQQEASIHEVVQIVRSPSISAENLTDALASANVAQLNRFVKAGATVAQFGIALAKSSNDGNHSIAEMFFEHSKGSAEAVAWLKSMLSRGLDPNLLVTDSYYEQHGLLTDAVKAGNATVVLALLEAGASPHSYQNVWLAGYSLPRFLFPYLSIQKSDRFTLSEKHMICEAMRQHGAVAMRFTPGVPGTNVTFQLSENERSFADAPIRSQTELVESPPDWDSTGSVIAARATGFNWPDLVQKIPARFEPDMEKGQDIGLFWVEIRNLINVTNDRAYFLGVAQVHDPQFALIEISKDARQWAVYVFMPPSAGMGICHCDVGEKAPPTECWRKYPMTYDASSQIVKVRDLYEYKATSRVQWKQYLEKLAKATRLTLAGHKSNVYRVVLSPDARWLASCGDRWTVKVWDVETGTEALTLNDHKGAISSVAFSPDGRRLASGDQTGTVKISDTEAKKETLTLNWINNGIASVAFSPDGQKVAGRGNDGTVKVWDSETGHEALSLRGRENGDIDVAFSPDGGRIVGGAKVWDGNSGAEVLTLSGKNHHVRCAAFSPDGAKIVSGSDDGAMYVRDVTKEAVIFNGHKEPVISAAFSPDSRCVASGDRGGAVKVWDAKTGKETLTLSGLKNGVASIAFSPDGRRVAGSDGVNGARIWDAETGKELLLQTVDSGRDDEDEPMKKGKAASMGARSFGSIIAFSPDDRHVASGNRYGAVIVRDIDTAKETLTLSGHTTGVTSLAYSSDGRRIVGGSGDRTVKIWDAETGIELIVFSGHNNQISSAAFSPDGRRIVSCDSLRNVKVWDAQTGKATLTLIADKNGVSSVAYTADGRRIVCGGKIWDADSGIEIRDLSGHSEGVTIVAFSPDGRKTVRGRNDNGLCVWDVESKPEALALAGHKDWVTAVAFSPDGRRVASGDRKGALKVWDATTGKETLTLSGLNYIDSVVFSPDGQRIACKNSSTVKIWNAETGQEIESLVVAWNYGVIDAVKFSPNGKWMASGRRNQMTVVWDGSTGAY